MQSKNYKWDRVWGGGKPIGVRCGEGACPLPIPHPIYNFFVLKITMIMYAENV